MKKYFIIAASALVAMCACTKNEVAEAPQQEINFAVANYAGQTKAGETYGNYSTSIPFGTYAWFYDAGAGTEAKPQVFMSDETVSYASSKWTPSKTYYWPKSGKVDFISYSPKSLSSNFTIAEKSIKIGTAYKVDHETKVDVMYADKATGLNANSTTYYTEGVPTLFRHALSKINIKVKTAYDSKTEGESITSWAVTITKLAVQKYYNTGSAEFTLNTSDNKSWNLPTNNVWANNGTAVNEQEFTLPTDKTISTTEKVFVADYFMLPQLLADQTLYLEATIETTLPNSKKITETKVPMEVKFKFDDTALAKWEINKNITYTLVVSPAGTGPDPDPKAILFDPAVENWDTASQTLETNKKKTE